MMTHLQDKRQTALDKQARLMLLGGLFAAGLAAPAPAPAQTLTVIREGTGNGVVTSNPPGIDCGADCTESYALNAFVDLTATAQSGSVLERWSGACSGAVGNSCQVLMDADQTVIAIFSQQPPNIQPLTTAITSACTGQPGEPIPLTGQAQGGTLPYAFTWSAPGGRVTNQTTNGGKTQAEVTFDRTGSFNVTLNVVDSSSPRQSANSTTGCAINAVQPPVQPQDGTLKPLQAPNSAGPNQTVTLSVRFTEGQQPRPNTPVGWVVTAGNGQPLPTNVTGKLRAPQTQTGADGISTNQFETGGQQFTYRITATVNTQSGPKTATFTLKVGLVPLVGKPTSTPEVAMAVYMDDTCENLFLSGATDQDSKDLLTACGQIATLSGPALAYTMNELTPTNNPLALKMAQKFGSQQMKNILLHLAELRSNGSGFSLSGLNINQNGQSLSANALDKAFARQKGGAAGDEPGADLGGRLGIFVNGTINRGDKSRSTQESGFDYDVYDITAGVDYRFTDQFVAGFALGYSSARSDLNDSGGDLDGSGYTLAGYANYFFGDNAFLEGIVQYGRGSFDMQRNINYIIPGVTKEFFTASASPDTRQWGASIGSGCDFKFDDRSIQATLSGHLNYLRATLDSYDESDAEPFNLHVEQNTLKSLTFNLGGEISRTFSLSWGVLTPRLRVDWLHEFEGNSVPIGGWLLADPIGGTSNSFTYQSDKQDSNYFLLGVGASAVFSHGVQAFLFYQTTLGMEYYTDNQITAGIRFEF